MNIEKKILLLEQYGNYFLGKKSKSGLFQKIYAYVSQTKDFDLEVCLFFKDLELYPKFKFQIFTDNTTDLEKLLEVIGKENTIKKNKSQIPFKGVQFVFSQNGDLIEFAKSHVLYGEDNSLTDISFKYTKNEKGDYNEIKRIYNHEYPNNYINDLPLCKVLNTFYIKDIVKLQKKFFSKNIVTYYLFLPSGKYFLNNFGDIFGLHIQQGINLEMPAFCVCLEKKELKKKKIKNLSIYLGTYGL